ncbi:metallophosphoesterase [Chryseobacterium sp. T1]
MKLFSSYSIAFLGLGIIFNSCATSKPQYGKAVQHFTHEESITKDNIAHTFYLVGDAGNADQDHAKLILNQFKKQLDNATENSTILFLGDNIYPSGLPNINHPDRKLAEAKLDDQIALVNNFKGKTIFVPGNHDWYSKGIVGLKNQQDYITEKLNDKKAFSPKNSCAIETRKIGKDIALITIDTEWFLADWEKNPGINEKCDIKTREDFFSEFENQLNKNQNKTIIVATHHPLLDHGSHGGFYSWEKQLFPLENKIPLPFLATGINLMRATGGITHQDLSNPNYRKLVDRLKTLLADRDNAIVVSGHDHNLQYIEKDNIKQIISGAGSKAEAATAINANDFSYGKNGYAILKISKSGEAEVSYFARENDTEKLLFRKQVLDNKNYIQEQFPTQFPVETTASVYEDKLTEKSKLHQWLWGKNYRSVYSTPVEAPTLQLDTLYGGASPNRAGGGHQTKSLRLDTPKGEYVIRALKKSGVRFLQSVAFKDQYVVEDFRDSFADQFLLDFYTSSHPYMALTIGSMAEKIGVKHTDPSLFYIPKQNKLGKYNQNFGNELYFLEVRPSETEENPNKVLSTDDVIKLLAKDEKYKMDEKAFIRARLFDMLIGDWDRHYDQWKWEQKNIGKNIIISPIPKDRDQAMVKYDGLITKMILDFPELRHMQSFEKKISNIKWFNREPYTLDLALTKNSTEEDWQREAEFIQQNITQDDIKKAFEHLPKEVQNEQTKHLQELLEIRKQDLTKYALEYYKVLQKTVLLTGTNKKDKFIINRLPNGETKVDIYRLKSSGEELISSKTYDRKTTKEIWLYGLDDNDIFEVKGEGKNLIKLRLLGGLNHDTYNIDNAKKVKIYDYKSKKNTYNGEDTSLHLTDDYELNQYDYKRPKYNFWTSAPNAGYNPDDKLILGLNASFVKRGFKQNPFTNKHTIKANYFTGTQGYEVAYEGIYPRLIGNWFYQLDARITSSHFIRNFYGLGNITPNQEDLYHDDYYRTRAKEISVSPSIQWRKNASHFSGKLVYEALKIEKTNSRYISTLPYINPDIFHSQHFGGVDLAFNFENNNKHVNPSLGMKFDFEFSHRINLENTKKQVPTIETGIGFIHYITKNEKLTFASYAKAKWILSNEYEFYQMATLGGDNSLRGFRFDRFYGKSSFYQSNDLRLDLGTIRNAFLPMKIGVFTGLDYGRVWLPNEKTQKWHNSYGAGFWLNAFDMIGANISYFRSEDGGRIVLGFGLDF